MFCPQCGSKVQDGGRFCPNCGAALTSAGKAAPMQTDARPMQTFSSPAVPKKHNALIAIVAVVLVIAVLVVGVSAVIGSSPFSKIASAAQKLEKAGNATIYLTMDVDNMQTELSMQVDFDLDKRDITAYGTMSAYGSEVILAIYDGYVITGMEFAGQGYYSCEDISSELDKMYDAYEQGESSSNVRELLDLLDDNFYGELYDVFDPDALESCANRYAKSLLKESWLEENAGYTSSKEDGTTYYTFEPNLYDFVCASMPFFEKAFIDVDDYANVMDEMDDLKSELNMSLLSISFGVRSGYLSNLDFEMDIDGEECSVHAQITEIGKTKFDEEKLADMLESAMRY